jgi:hypothetical protein
MQLLSQAKKSNRKAAETSICALRDLFVQGYLSIDDKKKFHVFTKNPVILSKKGDCSDQEITEAYYEHCIREIVRDFITSIL